MMMLKTITTATLVGCSVYIFSPEVESEVNTIDKITICYNNNPKGCIFKTLFGEESSTLGFLQRTPADVQRSIDQGLQWIVKAQQVNGGWGAGSHYNQNVIDPHAVNTDPATTAMVGMAILRTGSTLTTGTYKSQLKGALEYILNAVEKTPESQLKITEEVNTQIQSKLGDNIDAVLALQFLSNLHAELYHDPYVKNRVSKAMRSCVNKLEQLQDADGSITGSGWAGVLQSALANSALESAAFAGVQVDEDVIKKSQDYQQGNFDVKSGAVKTERGAGVVLYSVSGAARGSAKGARAVRDALDTGIRNGKIRANEPVNEEVLIELGFNEEEAEELNDAYQVFERSKVTAQDDNVMTGYGNNGGEEFLSFLQTGESLIISKDDTWEQWFDDISVKLISIQNEDGSWNGHHCITSPVFCTATALLTLSINNDVDRLMALGAE